MMVQAFSIHTFMFPFQWDYLAANPQKNIRYNKRTRIEDFDRLFTKSSQLERVKFQIGDSTSKYSEYNYFHPFVRKALYHIHDSDFLYYYEIDKEDGEYNISYVENKIEHTFNLVLDSICLHIYNTGVGVLSFNLTNNKYGSKEDILKINEFGRRLYPAYMSNSYGRLAAKGSVLAHKIWGCIGGLSFADDFTQYNEPILNNACFLPPQHIRNIFGYTQNAKIGDQGHDFVFRNDEERKGTIRIRQTTDDRMFFLCYYNNATHVDEIAEKVVDDKVNPANVIFKYEIDDFWYSYMFGDSGTPTVKNDRFQQKQMQEHTYSRWIDYHAKDKGCHGTLFGITRDSFVCLGAWEELISHMSTMYYQMAVLCLVQRASVLRFSYEIERITRLLLKGKKNSSKLIKEIYENYITFINRIYFREITSQIQGIEMYAKFQEAMSLEKDVKDLDSEMEELFHYLDIAEQNLLNRTANLYLPIAIATAFFGINTFIPRENTDNASDNANPIVGVLNKPLSNDFSELWNELIQFTWADAITVGLIVWIIYAIIRSFTLKK